MNPSNEKTDSVLFYGFNIGEYMKIDSYTTESLKKDFSTLKKWDNVRSALNYLRLRSNWILTVELMLANSGNLITSEAKRHWQQIDSTWLRDGDIPLPNPATAFAWASLLAPSWRNPAEDFCYIPQLPISLKNEVSTSVISSKLRERIETIAGEKNWGITDSISQPIKTPADSAVLLYAGISGPVQHLFPYHTYSPQVLFSSIMPPAWYCMADWCDESNVMAIQNRLSAVELSDDPLLSKWALLFEGTITNPEGEVTHPFGLTRCSLSHIDGQDPWLTPFERALRWKEHGIIPFTISNSEEGRRAPVALEISRNQFLHFNPNILLDSFYLQFLDYEALDRFLHAYYASQMFWAEGFSLHQIPSLDLTEGKANNSFNRYRDAMTKEIDSLLPKLQEKDAAIWKESSTKSRRSISGKKADEILANVFESMQMKKGMTQ